jgi:hypothetical protein
MQGTVVMLIALSGLGCQNKGCDVMRAPPAAVARCYVNGDPHTVAPSGYPGWSASRYSGYDDSGDSCGGALRNTFISFVLGHDPDVPTVREIEASVDSRGYGDYRQPDSIPSARQPPRR